MSIQSEITRITSARESSFTAVEEKGVTVPTNSTIDDLPGLIRSIQVGGDYVSYAETQSLTSAQQETARTNIGVTDMTAAEASTGSSTTAKMISPAVLTEAIQVHATAIQYWQYNSSTDTIDLIFPS